MTDKKSRPIPGVTIAGKTRGGGSESIEWVRNGPLLLVRSYTRYNPVQSNGRLHAGQWAYCGVRSLPTLPLSSDNAVKSAGNAALAITRPTSSSVNVLTSAGELAKDGLPSVRDFIRWRQTAGAIIKNMANNYVAIQFAWLPLKREIQTWAGRVVEHDRVIQQARDSSLRKRIKVGYSFPSTGGSSSSSERVPFLRWTSGSAFALDYLGHGNVTRTSMEKIWFEGTYLNLFPASKQQVAASSSFADKAKALLGPGLTPEVLWNLTPWSWAADWVSNTDQIVASVSDALSDGVVVKDGFVMRHYRIQSLSETVVGGYKPLGAPWYPVFPITHSSSVSERKTRFSSIPYFGFGPAGELSTRQLSILAALGISRA